MDHTILVYCRTWKNNMQATVRTKDIFTTRLFLNCLKNHQIENLFWKKETSHFSNNILIQNYKNTAF